MPENQFFHILSKLGGCFFHGFNKEKAAEQSQQLLMLSGFSGREVFADHQRHLKHDGVVELTQIQTGELLDLLQAVHQGVPVDKELPGGFGNVQVVFEELVDGEIGRAHV